MKAKKSILEKVRSEFALKKEAKELTTYSVKMGMLSWEFVKDSMADCNCDDGEVCYENDSTIRFADTQQDTVASVFKNCDIVPALFYSKDNIESNLPLLENSITNILSQVLDLRGKGADDRRKKFAGKYFMGDTDKLSDLEAVSKDIHGLLKTMKKCGLIPDYNEALKDIAAARIFAKFNKLTNEMGDNFYRSYLAEHTKSSGNLLDTLNAVPPVPPISLVK